MNFGLDTYYYYHFLFGISYPPVSKEWLKRVWGKRKMRIFCPRWSFQIYFEEKGRWRQRKSDRCTLNQFLRDEEKNFTMWFFSEIQFFKTKTAQKPDFCPKCVFFLSLLKKSIWKVPPGTTRALILNAVVCNYLAMCSHNLNLRFISLMPNYGV